MMEREIESEIMDGKGKIASAAGFHRLARL